MLRFLTLSTVRTLSRSHQESLSEIEPLKGAARAWLDVFLWMLSPINWDSSKNKTNYGCKTNQIGSFEPKQKGLGRFFSKARRFNVVIAALAVIQIPQPQKRTKPFAVCSLEMKIPQVPFGNQTWFAGKWTIYQ